MSTSLVKAPLNMIESASVSKNDKLMQEFMHIVRKLYQYEAFKPMLDLATTLVNQGRLKFVIEPKEFYHLDHGHCLTIEGGMFDKFSNSFKRTKSYKISIKKISSDVIIHEIGHMVEKECNVVLGAEFTKAIMGDLQKNEGNNMSLRSAVNDIMISELKGYPQDQRASELFTRYFQLMAMTREVMGMASPYGFKIEDMYRYFTNYSGWLVDHLFVFISKFIDPSVAKESAKYIVDLGNIKTKWTDEKIRPMHHSPNPSQKPKWSSSIKPNFD